LTHSFKRSKRVGELIIREISEMIVKGKIKDPRIDGVVLTDIRITDDLKNATIYFTNYISHENNDEVLIGLLSASKYIKRELTKILRLKRIPDLTFKSDQILETGYRIDRLLREEKLD